MDRGANLKNLLAQWQRERPDLDTFCMAVCGEIWRAGNRLMSGLQDNLDAHALDFPSFDVLLTLRRNGQEARLTPSELSDDCMLSASAMTARLNKLETRGLIAREPCLIDKRSVLIRLTREGLKLTKPLVEGHVAAEQSMLAALSPTEQSQLLSLLGKVAHGASLSEASPPKASSTEASLDGAPHGQ